MTHTEPAVVDATFEPELPADSGRSGARPVAPTGRPSDLAQSIRGLTRTLRNVRAVALNAADKRALAELLPTVLHLARAHARKGQSIVFPSLEEAEQAHRKARRR